MERNKRELALLYRIRDLFIACEAMYSELKSPSSESVTSGIVHSVSKTLAIEEGKQAADFEHFQITLQTLDNRMRGTNRSWPKKRAR